MNVRAATDTPTPAARPIFGSNPMILSALLVLQAHTTSRSKPVAPPAELAYVRSFLRLADSGRDGKPLPVYGLMGEPTVDSPSFVRPGSRSYNFRFAWVSVYLDSGRIAFFSGGLPSKDYADSREPDGMGGDRVVPRALTDAETAARAAQIYAASGGPGGIQIEGITDLMGPNNTCVEVRYTPAWEGVPYDERMQSLMDLDRQTGRLDSFGLARWLPEPPASLVPGGPAEAARAIALRFAAARAGEPVAEMPTHPVALRLWLPGANAATPRAALARAYPPAVLAALDAWRAMLVYQGTVVGSSWRTSANVTLDARTGEPLDARPFPDPRSFGGPSPAAPKPDLAVPTAARSWRIATGGRDWDAWTPPVKATLVPAEGAAPTGGKLTLTDGEAAFPATYDLKANLLGIAGKAYRPGPALAELLKRRAKG